MLQQFLQITLSGVVTGSIYGMAALGFTIVYNATRVMNFANGDFVMMGGLVAAALVTDYQVPILFAVIIAVAVVACLGIALDRLALQHARRQNVLTLVMITIAAGITFRGLMQLVIGRDVYFMPPFGGIPSLVLGGLYLSSQGVWILIMLLVTSGGLWFLFAHTRIGKAMRAVSENARGAALCGINPALMSILSYAIAASLGALAGALIAPIASGYYENGIFLTLKGFAAAILGGMGNPLGAIVGGLLIGFIESFSAGYAASGYKDAVALVILLVVLVFRPSGLLGHVEAKRV